MRENMIFTAFAPHRCGIWCSAFLDKGTE